MPLPGLASLHPGYEKRQRNKEAERRQAQGLSATSVDAARAGRSALAFRRSTAALAKESISSPRRSFRPGFVGRGLAGVTRRPYPSSSDAPRTPVVMPAG